MFLKVAQNVIKKRSKKMADIVISKAIVVKIVAIFGTKTVVKKSITKNTTKNMFKNGLFWQIWPKKLAFRYRLYAKTLINYQA